MNSKLFVTFDKEINERVFCLMGLNEHHNYSFEFYGDSVIQKNQTASITARLLDDGVPLMNQNISFVVDGTTTSATTDEFGEATISYMGTGKGKVQIQANYGTLLQETFVLGDYIEYGVDITKWTLPSQITYNFVDGLHTFTAMNSSTGTYMATDNNLINGDFHLELTGINTPSWTGRIDIISPSENKTNTYSLYNLSDATLVIERKNGVFSATLNGSPKSTQETQLDFSSDCRMRIRCYLSTPNKEYMFSFKELKVYSV